MHSDPAAYELAVKLEARADLHFFSRYMFKQRKGYRWLDNWHHKVICDALMRVYRGECHRLLICIPPRYSKTELAVVNFIAWALGNAPDAEFIHTSYSTILAQNNASLARQLVETPEYSAIFPELRLMRSAKAKGDWRTTAGGVVYAQGEGGTITGFGAGKLRPGFGGAIIFDDIHKPDEAHSDLVRKGVLTWFQNTLESRVNSPHTPIIGIGQRLHDEDLPGWLMAGGNGETWEVVNIPAIAERDNPYGREIGTALWDAKHDIEALRRMEASKPYEFSGQYQQRPSPAGGGIFKTDWWQYFKPAALPPLKRVIQSWDTAFKTKTSNDFSVCTTWGEGVDRNIYLLDVWSAKMEFPELKRMVASKGAQSWGGKKVSAVLVEDKASGQSLIQELRQGTGLAIIAIQVDTDKVTRAFAVTPMIEGKRVYVAEGAPWLADYVQQMASFPKGAHDDVVDSTTQALSYFSDGSGAQAWIDHLAKAAAEVAAAQPK